MRSSIVCRLAAATLLCWLAAGAALAQTQNPAPGGRSPDTPSAAPKPAPAPAAAGAAAGTTAGVSGVVNINTASPEELQLLPGIGPAKAKAIVAYRTAQGPFKKVDDLLNVTGIGARFLERLRPLCSTDGKTTLQRAQR